MQSLLGGADCSTSSNPLKQVLQREGIDNSIFRDRLAPTAGPSFRPQPQQAQQQNRGPGVAGPAQRSGQANASSAFNFSGFAAHLGGAPRIATPGNFDAEWDRARHSPAPQQGSGFSGEFARHGAPASGTSDWASSFEGKGKGRAMAATPAQHMGMMQPPPQLGGMPYQPSYSYGGGGMGGMGGYQPALQPMYQSYGGAAGPHISEVPAQAHSQAQEMALREREQEDMNAAFERALQDARAKDAEELAATQGTADAQTEEEPEEDIREAKGDFEKVWESLRPEAERLGELAKWEHDFNLFENDEDDLNDILNDSLRRADVGQHSLEEQLEGMPDMFGMQDPETGLPTPTMYEFVNPNPFDHLSAQACYTTADRLLYTGGSLSDAALLLESFIQRATVEDFQATQQTEAGVWGLLGNTHAMDEKEEKAVAAYQRGLRALESGDQTNVDKTTGAMLTNLAISYVNESRDLAALTTLHRFLTLLHPTHAGPAPSRSDMQESTNPWAQHHAMRDRFLSLAREQYERGGQVDPDVQVALATLYYMMGEYEEARGCWVNAVAERPDDYLLWNRLGATLANGGSPEEAVDAYRRALELKPTFTRAIYNLGVACLNIGVYREAVEHFLAALSLHPTGQGDAQYDSVTLWYTLRRALKDLKLDDLAERASPGTDLEVFRQAGFEF